MTTSTMNDRRYFSRASYLALPYLIYFIVSAEFLPLIPEKFNRLIQFVYLTWLPVFVPGVFLGMHPPPNIAAAVVQSINMVLDVYLWAWLITRLQQRWAIFRRKEPEERITNVT